MANTQSMRAFLICDSSRATLISGNAAVPIGVQQLIYYMENLWRIARDRLLTVPNEEQRRLEYLNAILSRSRKSHGMIVTIDKQLREAIEDKNQAVRWRSS